MLEIDIIKGYEKGDFKGIIYDGDFAYIPLRLTGTGKVDRTQNGEYRIVDRKMELFSTPILMKAYANLPVVLNHPTNENGEFIRASVDTPEYFVGNTIHSYILGNEIWVIARIQNKEVIDYIASNEVSTSPHFSTKELKEDDYFIEIPDKINSLAIVANGFWDKKSIIPPVDNSDFNIIDEKGEIIMEKEEIKETKEDKADSVMVGEASKADKCDSDDKKEETKEDKADSSDKDEKEEKEEKTDKADELPSEASVKEEVQELINNEAQEANHFQELANQHDKFKGEKVESDFVTGDEYNEDDILRDEILEIITDVVDSAPKELGVKRVFIGNDRLKPHALIKRFLKSNKNLIDSKYQGVIEKIDGSMVEIGRDIINNVKNNIDIKCKELNKPVESESKVTYHRDGTKSFKLI